MRQRHTPLLVVHFNGLAVVPVVFAGGAVTRVRHRHGARRERSDAGRREHVSHQPQILLRKKESVVVHNDPAALLAAVLQSV